MSVVQNWWRNPQRVWLRRAIFQIHLWSGLALGAYVVVICASGSALVFRNELSKKYLTGPTTVAVSGTRLTDDELKAVALRLYPGYDITDVWPAKQANYAVEIWLEHNKGRTEELFNPYTGQDLGAAEPTMIRFLVWLAYLHDDLLYDYNDIGRTINGLLGLALVIVCLTGAVIWWPGVGIWRRSLGIEWKANWKRFNWTLHSAIGFWAFIIVFGFAFTGFYLVFQDPFIAVVDYLEPAKPAVRGVRRALRPGDLILRWMATLHFGRFRTSTWRIPLQSLYVVIGLIPVFLFVTGAFMWWNRVLSPALHRLGNRSESTDDALGILSEKQS
jgi:uncharacterized iron-regulated membrane protein